MYKTSTAVRGISRIVIAATLTLNLGSCSDSVKPTKAAAARTATKSERTAQAHRILKHINLPSAIHDAHFDEVEEGDGKGLGPTDYVSYMYLKVPLTEIGKWVALQEKELGYVPAYSVPVAKYKWWVDSERFKTLLFFEPQPLSSQNGWVAISKETGEIWIQDFTT